jgi:lipid-binding SYLF domain-containing protein
MMATHIRSVTAALLLTMTVLAMGAPRPAGAASPQGPDPDVQAALTELYQTAPIAKTLAAEAKGVLVFPKVYKAGFIVGAQHGRGELLKNGRHAGYYNIAAASYGLQAGVQGFSYAMFFMRDSALTYFENSAGFEVGVGPSIVVVDAGKAKSLTTTTGRDDVYAFIFGQKGLMAGLGLQGSKITKVGQ